MSRLRALLLGASATLVAVAAASAQPAPQAAPTPAAPTPVPASPPTVTDVSGQFPRGPYSALAIAPGDASRVAVGTESGVVAWRTHGAEVATADALIFRKMDPVTLRGTGGYASLAKRAEDPPQVRVKGAARDPSEGSEDDEVRSLHSFLHLLNIGMPPARWHVWMSVADPQTIVSDLALPTGGGKMAMATSSGIWVSDESRGSWGKAFGAPGVMPRERDPMGLAVGIDPRDPRRILASTDSGLLVSTDGGANFMPHRDRAVEGAWITKITWDPANPDLVFLVTPDQIFLSQDGGNKFEPSFSAAGEIRDLALSPDAAIVATSEGLYLAYADRLDRALEGKDVIGAVPWRDGAILAATAGELYLVQPGLPARPLLTTTPRDPYLRMAGRGDVVWLLSRDAVLRLGDVERGSRARQPPRLLLTPTQIEHAVVDHNGLGGPLDARLHGRWYAKLLPNIDASVDGRLRGDESTVLDGTFPVRERYLRAGSRDRLGWSVMASWDLSDFVFGDSNPVNANLIIETNLRERRKVMLENVHRAYREAAQLAAALKHPPAGDHAALLDRLRLAELGAYLEFMSGRPVVGDLDSEKP